MRTKLSFITYLLFGFISVYGQTYIPFPDSNAIWSVSTEKYSVLGDTVINDKEYKKYYKTSRDSTFTFERASYFAAVREDTSKRIWAIKHDSSIERLQYDFSLEIGDTVTVTPIGDFDYWEGSYTVEIRAIDSILINQIYHKKFNLLDWEAWIEGIGSSMGIFHSGLSALGTADIGYPILLCFEIEDNITYFTYDSICYDELHGGAIDNLSDPDPSCYFYPNPFNNSTTLHIKDFNSTTLILDLFDMTGQFIDSYKIIHNDFIINNFKYKPGLYYYRLKNENHTYGSGILMKQI